MNIEDEPKYILDAYKWHLGLTLKEGEAIACAQSLMVISKMHDLSEQDGNIMSPLATKALTPDRARNISGLDQAGERIAIYLETPLSSGPDQPIPRDELGELLRQFVEKIENGRLLAVRDPKLMTCMTDILRSGLQRSMKGMDGLSSFHKDLTHLDTVQTLMNVDEQTGEVSPRQVIPTPFRCLGSCTLCLGDERVELISALHGGDMAKERTIEERREMLLGKFLNNSKLNKQTNNTKVKVLERLIDMVDDRHHGAHTVPLLIPKGHSVLIGLLCKRTGRHGVSWQYRLACKSCFDGLDNPKGSYYSFKLAETISDVFFQMRNMPMIGIAKHARAANAEMNRKVTALKRSSSLQTNTEDTRVFGARLDKHEVHDLCTELLAAGLTEFVHKPKGKGKLMQIARGNNIKDVMQLLKGQEVQRKSETKVDDLLGSLMQMSVPSEPELSDAEQLSHGGHHIADLLPMTKSELKLIAEEIDIKVKSRWTKDELINKIIVREVDIECER